MHDLAQRLGRAKVAQSHRAELAQRNVRRQASGDVFGHRTRNEDLATVRGAHDAGCPVHRRPEEIVVAPLVGA